jgi:hypothetical protein
MRIINLLFISALIITHTNANAQCGTPEVSWFGTIQTTNSSSPYWKPVTGASGYNLKYRKRNAGQNYSTAISTTDTIVTLSNLSASTNYEFIVQSQCNGDTSAYSASGWFTTLSGGTQTGTISRGPYMTVPHNDKITIQWGTATSTNSEVRYGTTEGGLNNIVNDASQKSSHSITLSGLTPNTKYYYSVGTIGNSLEQGPNNYFFSSPVENDSVPLRFWVTGDFGNGSYSQRAVRDAFANYNSGQRVDGWLWLGDNAYANGLDAEYQTKVFDVYPDQLRNIPVFPALGNHDYAQSGYQSSASRGTNFPYFQIFNLPNESGTEKYYSANYGNVHFIALDSYGSYNAAGSPMYNWLEADLMNNTQQWTIVYFHHAPYTKGSHDSDVSAEDVDMRNNIIPLLESNGVDLVLCGHSHTYERSKFIKGHFGPSSTFSQANVVQSGGGPYSKTSRTGNGTVYVVCGVSGETNSATSNGWPHNAMYVSSNSFLGSLILDISGSNLTCGLLKSNGAIGDQFSITKPGVIPTTSVKEISSGNNQLYVAPNPANDEFSVYSNGLTGTYKLNITNAFGQIVYSKDVSANDSKHILTLRKQDIHCAAGLYHITMTNEKESSTCSLVIN